MTELKNMLIRHAIFHSELFSWFIFLVSECEILNFVDAGRRTHTPSLAVTAWTTCLLSVERVDTARHVNFLFKCFILSIFHCLPIVEGHVAQTCGYITLADSQTFYQMSVFNGKTHNLHDVTNSKK